MARITVGPSDLSTIPSKEVISLPKEVSVAPTPKIEEPVVIQENIQLEQVFVESQFDPTHLQDQIDDLKRLAGMPTEVIKERVIEHKLDTTYVDVKIEEISKKLLTKDDVRDMLQDHKEKLQILHEQIFMLKNKPEKKNYTKLILAINALLALLLLVA